MLHGWTRTMVPYPADADGLPCADQKKRMAPVLQDRGHSTAWLVDADCVPQLAERSRLDVPNSLAGHIQLLRQLLKASHTSVPKTVAVLYYRPLLRLQYPEDSRQVLAV